MTELRIDIDEVLDQLPIWASTEVKCDFCNKIWLAVHSIFTTKLECPKCNNINDIVYLPLQEKFN